MVELLRCFRLPPLVRQHKIMVGGRRVRFDLAYPEKHIVVELEGWEGHSGRDRWQSDHDRHNAVELAEWRTLQFTWTDVTQRPYYVAFTIAEKLGLRPARWVPYKRPG
jgi:very-short-patch-repair endonuclease